MMITMPLTNAELTGYDPNTRSVTIIASNAYPVEGAPITEWDFSRFEKNPTILWNHDSFGIPIGKASDVRFSVEEGLVMRVRFASKDTNPTAEQVASGVQEGMIRAVSVGYEDLGNGKARLLEVSFVTMGADEDAGTPLIDPSNPENADVLLSRDRAAAKDLEQRLARGREIVATTKTDARLAFELACNETRLDGSPRTHVVEARAEDGSIVVHKFGTRIEASRAKRALKRSGSYKSVTMHPEDSPFRTNEEGKTRDATKEESDAALAGAHMTKAKEMAANGNTDDAKKHGDEAMKKLGRFDAVKDSEVVRFDRAPMRRLDKLERTNVGGTKIPSRLTRTGILEYRNLDGTIRKELRRPEDVFKADSLASLEHAPIIDIAHHTGLVTADTWRKVSLGHVTGVRRDGNFVESDLLVQDRSTLDAIDAKERTEISCGYRCTLDMTPGVYEGQRYDCVQTDIVYNHVALCPPNRGRAGPEVGLRIDSNNPWAIAHHYDAEEDMKTIRIDGKDYEVGSDAHILKLEEMHGKELDKVRTDAKAEVDAKIADLGGKLTLEVKRADKAEGERDAAKADLEKFNADAKKAADDAAKTAEEEKKERTKSRKLRRRIERVLLRFFAKDDEKKDDEKMDALVEDKTDRDLMIECFARRDGARFDAKAFEGKSDDYVSARFDAMVEGLQAHQDRGLPGVVLSIEQARRELDQQTQTNRNDAGDDDPVTKARLDMERRAAEMGRPKTG